MGYQAGDMFCGPYQLRLTMGALAEISARLGASGPSDLATLFRRDERAIHTALVACLRPCQNEPESVAKLIADADAKTALAKLFEAVFAKETA